MSATCLLRLTGRKRGELRSNPETQKCGGGEDVLMQFFRAGAFTLIYTDLRRLYEFLVLKLSLFAYLFKPSMIMIICVETCDIVLAIRYVTKYCHKMTLDMYNM